MSKGFDSSVPATPRQGQYVAATAYTDNENQGVVVALVPCSECGAATEEGAVMDKHLGWHAAQAGSGPKK
jgi:hypothetical protein